MPEHAISIRPSDKAALKELGYQTRTNQTAVLISALREYGSQDPRPIADKDPMEELKNVTVKFQIDEEVWAAARSRADAEGVSISSVIQEFLGSREVA